MSRDLDSLSVSCDLDLTIWLILAGEVLLRFRPVFMFPFPGPLATETLNDETTKVLSVQAEISISR